MTVLSGAAGMIRGGQNTYVEALRYRTPRGQTVLLGAHVKENRLVLYVTDQGAGLDEGEAGKLFTLFYTTRDRGTGLGLPLVRKTAELHGGSAQVSRAGPEGGTVAILELPSQSEVQGTP